MEQFLGALSFAKDLGRTLVLPHLVEYPERMPTSVNNKLNLSISFFFFDFFSKL
jgi:hypothetical protein